VVGRAVAGVLVQTFCRLEVVVVDDGSTDGSVRVVRAVADRRVRIVPADDGSGRPAWAVGVAAARGRFLAVVAVDDEVEPGWLARLGQLLDATGAAVVACGGVQRHRDGSRTRLTDAGARPGALVVERALAQELDPPLPDLEAHLARSLERATGRDLVVVRTPEALVTWNDPVEGGGDPDTDDPDGARAQLLAAQQALEALARSPIPDEVLLARYATTAGIAAVQLGEFRTARRMFALARSSRPDVARHWARWAVSLVPPLAVRAWPVDGHPAGEVDAAGHHPTPSARPGPVESVRSLQPAPR
jgi:glycosyltransferase involved in cell wall biosynthesis